ncbi:MAG: sulfotransferase, partial [Verrucomicrobiota bacterium]
MNERVLKNAPPQAPSKSSLIRQIGRKIPELVTPVFSTPEKWLFSSGILSPKLLSLPDFLGIGAPQSGTTWLYENLRCHPDIFMPERKELRYFEKNFYKSLSLYYAPKFKKGFGKVKGEITPSYGKMPLARIRFIKKLIPIVKLILILRNPIDRIWAATRRAFAKIPGKRLEEATESEILASFHYAPRKENTDFPKILDHWSSIFPKEQLFVGFFEEITGDPQNLLRNIFSFLEVSPDV